MRKKIGWWEPDPGVHAVVKRIAKPIRTHVFRWVRELRGLERQEVADRLGLQVTTIESLEQGKYVPKEEHLERLVASLGISPAMLEDFMSLAEEIREDQVDEDQWLGPVRISGLRLRRAREYGRNFGNVQRRRFTDGALRCDVEKQVAKDRETAVHIGHHIRQKKNVVEFVRQDKGCHLWSVAEWLCEESTLTAPKSRDRAGEYAEAALVVAELAPGDERFLKRLKGLSWGHIGNIHRLLAGYDAPRAFREANRAFRECASLWVEGEGGDPYKLLDAGKVLGLEASLRKDEGRLCEALSLLEEAMPIARKSLQPYLAVNYGTVLEFMGDSEGAIRVLEDAAKVAPPHLLFYAKFNVGVNLCHLGRHIEAEALLSSVEKLAAGTESRSNEMLVRWLSCKVDAGLGRSEAAVRRLRRLQSELVEEGDIYDAALVTMEIAKICLEQGEIDAVKAVTRDLARFLEAGGVHHYAREALELFQKAVDRENASLDFVVRLATYLYQARRSPGLRFEYRE